MRPLARAARMPSASGCRKYASAIGSAPQRLSEDRGPGPTPKQSSNMRGLRHQETPNMRSSLRSIDICSQVSSFCSHCSQLSQSDRCDGVPELHITLPAIW
eukprot:3096685-Pyramimonas_sp.AAC.1